MSIETLSERSHELPDITIIQGGMGIGVSWYRLAGAVAAEGEMGVVSGTVIGPVLARRLQDGDPDGCMREALSAFPDQEIANQIIKRYYSKDGREENQPYKTVPAFNADSRGLALKLNMAGAFTEVWLAKHIASQKSETPGPIGINLLTKLQEPTLSALYGAMLAGVDCVIMGAGIPYDIPNQLGNLALGIQASLRFDVSESSQEYYVTFDPADYPDLLSRNPLKKPHFLAIVASNTLATRLSRNENSPTGFIIEGPPAGGHNAPPRNKVEYGPRDDVDLNDIARLSLPFWLAGGYDSPERLKEAQDKGANGIQVGTAFAVCKDSGFDPALRERIINQATDDGVEVVTDMRASPTGFPFKVAQIPGTISEESVLKARQRVCDLGFLREAYADKGSEFTIGSDTDAFSKFVDGLSKEELSDLSRKVMTLVGSASFKDTAALKDMLSNKLVVGSLSDEERELYIKNLEYVINSFKSKYESEFTDMENETQNYGNVSNMERIKLFRYISDAKFQKDVIKYRCASEPEEDYVNKGGKLEDTIGRTCLCNGLMATIGLGQTRHGKSEKPIITAGDNLTDITQRLTAIYGSDICAKDVLRYLRGK